MTGRWRLYTGLTLLAALGLATSGVATEEPTVAMNLLEEILLTDNRFTSFVADPEHYRLQAVLGLIEEDEHGSPRLVQHGYRLEAEYFYPASTIKLCAAVAALEQLTELAATTGLPLDETTPLVYHPLFEDEVLESTDASNLAGGHLTVGHEVRKLFLVSDNVAYNRLYELVGQDAIHRSMHRAGLSTARIVHRLSEARTVEQNQRSPRIVFTGKDFRHEIPARITAADLSPISIEGLKIGRGYLSAGRQINEPLDFEHKNRMSLVDLQRALCKLTRPDIDVGGEPFRLSERQRGLMLEAMGQFPGQSRNPVYDPSEYPDDWVKFLLPGLERVVPRGPDGKARVEVLNKVGQAYGFSIENAYVRDPATGQAFFLAAVIYTNSDGILNDDRYEYEELALPFFADLGEAVARALWSEELVPHRSAEP